MTLVNTIRRRDGWHVQRWARTHHVSVGPFPFRWLAAAVARVAEWSMRP